MRKKGNREYSDLINPVVKFLVNKEFMKRAVNTAEIMITEEGVTMCGERRSYWLVFPGLSDRLIQSSAHVI